jgi:hypothetical protein
MRWFAIVGSCACLPAENYHLVHARSGLLDTDHH